MQKIQLIDAETLYYKPLEHPRMLIDGILSDELGKDRPNLANGLWSRSLLRQKRRPWSSFPMTQGLQIYYIA